MPELAEGPVWYFGEDCERLFAIEQRYGADRLSVFSERVAAAAGALRDDYRQLDALLQPTDRDLWDATDLGERSFYNSPLLQEAAYALALAQAVRSGQTHLAFVDDVSLAWAIVRVCTAAGLVVFWQRPGARVGLGARMLAAAAALKEGLSGIRAYLGGCRASVRGVLALRRQRKAQARPADELPQVDLMLALWTDPGTFKKGEAQPLRSTFGPLPRALAESGLRCGYLALPLSWLHDMEEIAANTLQSGHPVLFPEDCWSPAQVMWAAVKGLWWRLPLAGGWRHGGFDLAPLVARAVWRERLRWRRVQARLVMNVGSRLAALGVRPQALIAPYENQSWEKNLRLGLSCALPSTVYIGCQLSLFAPDQHSWFPTDAEVAEGRLPDLLLTMGSYFTELFAERGFPSGRMLEVGALRYPPLGPSLPEHPPARPLQVLCGTAVEFGESLELAHAAVAAINHLEDAQVVINFHPVIDHAARNLLRRSLEARHGPAMAKVEFSPDSAAALLERVDVVVYNGSGVAFDAFAKGIPAVYVRRELGLDYDKVPDGVATRVRGAMQLAAVLREFAQGGPLFDRTVVAQILPRMMGPVGVKPLVTFLAALSHSSDRQHHDLSAF